MPERTRYRLIRAAGDKPHRCPLCWKVAPKAYTQHKPPPVSLYRCDDCKVKWFRRPLIPIIGARLH